MAARTVEEQVSSLLEKRIVESRVHGSPNTQLEARALFDSVILSLMSRPKTVLYAMLLAKNGLAKAVADELATLDLVLRAVADLANPSYAVNDLKPLQKARLAAVQLGSLQHIDTKSPQFQKLDSSIDSFLSGALSKNVRRKGSTELVRPGLEAEVDLPEEFEVLKGLHADVLSRLQSLRSGVADFLSLNFSTLLGQSTTSRVRRELEDILEELQRDSSGTASRDVAVRLISARAALKVLGREVSLYSPVLDSAGTPDGHLLQVIGDAAPARKGSSVGPFVLGPAASVTVEVGSQTVGSGFPQSDFDLADAAAVVSSAGISYPVTIPSNYYLFLDLDGSKVKVPLTAGSRALQDIVTDVALALTGVAQVSEYVTSGSGRIVIAALSAQKLRVESTHYDGSSFYTNSAHELLGLREGQEGEAGETDLDYLVDAFNLLFGTLVVAQKTGTDSFEVVSLEDAPGTTLEVTCPVSLGLAGTHTAKAATLRLSGKVFGKNVEEANPALLLDPGDRLATSAYADQVVGSVTSTRIVLEEAVPTSAQNVSVASSLDWAYLALEALLEPVALQEDLSKIELALAGLSSGSSPAQRATAVRLLEELQTSLETLQSVLEDSSTSLPKGAASRERETLNGIVASFEERGYTRAVDLLLRGKVKDVLELTHEDAAYGTHLLSAMESFSKVAVKFPDLEKNAELGPSGRN